MGVASSEAAVERREQQAARQARFELARDASARELTEEERESFFEYVRAHQGCSVRDACRAVALRRRDVRHMRKTVREFEEEWRDAQGWGQEATISALKKLGIDGVEEYVVSAGKIVTYPEGHPRAGEMVTQRRYDSRATLALFGAMTDEGRAAAAGKLGIEVNVDVGKVEIQQGVGMDAIAAVFAAAGVTMPALEAPAGTAEVVAVEDVPVE